MALSPREERPPTPNNQTGPRDSLMVFPAVTLKKGLTALHVTTLDEVVSVNSFFTVAVFIGLSLVTPNTTTLLSPTPSDLDCLPTPDTVKQLLVFMVISFSCFQFSSLIAHGMKLSIVLKNGENKDESHWGEVSYRFLRLGMAASSVGSIAGTTFLMLALLSIIQLRFGKLDCASNHWAKWAAIPLLVLVPTGLLTFITSVFHGLFFH
eukprot:TRINITY_DN1969_c0_g2_i1.p1 TRINITY_DN1969_c0_g2~~TRINITY_DN1969_c0_g2_i1.p1  ORF type:complete len:208 (-),score=27.09 TRINITY_DN1969_c0_g2_i1:975-1598(-)